jgi:hypothetical protein
MISKPVTLSEEEMEDNDEDQQRHHGESNEVDEDEDWVDEDEEDDDNSMPSYEFRFECAKMLLELDDTTETAIQVSVEQDFCIKHCNCLHVKFSVYCMEFFKKDCPTWITCVLLVALDVMCAASTASSSICVISVSLWSPRG